MLRSSSEYGCVTSDKRNDKSWVCQICIYFCFLFTITSLEIKVNVLTGAFFPQNYNRLELPNTQDATIILLSLHILDMYDVSEAEMSYSVRFYFRQHWLDPRLKVSTHSITTSEKYRIDPDSWWKMLGQHSGRRNWIYLMRHNCPMETSAFFN